MSVTRDQNNVVWFPGGFMSKACYEDMQLPVSFEDLPFCDSHQQNIVDVDEEAA